MDDWELSCVLSPVSKSKIYIDELRRVIKAVHGVEAVWFRTRFVAEKDENVEMCDVEVFDVTGHAKAQQCFAWGVLRDDNKEWDVTTVLGVPPVVTPELAVKTAMAVHARQAKTPR